MPDSDERARRPEAPLQQRFATRTAQRRSRSVPLVAGLKRNQLIVAGSVVLLIVVGLGLLFGRQGASTSDTGAGASPASSQSAGVAIATPKPAVRRAQVARLGGGPGRLHEVPAFDTPTLTRVLREGDEVQVLDRQKTDAKGNRWQLVAIEDYVGWIPASNLEPRP